MPLDPGPRYHGDLSHAFSTNYSAQGQSLDLTHKFQLSQVWKAHSHRPIHSKEKPVKAQMWLGCQSHLLPYSSAQLLETNVPSLKQSWMITAEDAPDSLHNIFLRAAGKICAQTVKSAFWC